MHRPIVWLARDQFTKMTLGIAMLFLLLTACANAVGVRINLTESMPIGFYREMPFNRATLHRGEIVAVCVPREIAALARRRGYLHHGHCPENTEPLLKHIGALPGDRIDVRAGGVRVNGRALVNSARRERDSNGALLAHVADGSYTVARDSVWISAPVARSWDSRYYGALPITAIEAAAPPLLTW